MKRKIINIICIFLTIVCLMSNFSYGIFTPYIYEAEDKSVIAYAELNAANIYLPSGECIQRTNINGGTQMNIEKIMEPIEVVLVIDVSGSMKSNGTTLEEGEIKPTGKTRLETAQQAAINFVENFFNVAESIKISVIAFNSKASTKITKSSDKSAIESAINALSPGGGTKMLPALKQAENILFNKEQDNTHSFLVNLTDGATDGALSCYTKLLEMQNKNIGIYNVLLETGRTEAFSQDGVDAGTLYTNVSSEELMGIYDEIYNLVCSEVVDNKIDSFIENAQNYFVADNNLFMHLDKEMLQGSRLDLEYIINIKTAFNCTKIRLQEEVDKKLNFNPSSKMISEDKTNADYGWKVNEQLSYKKNNDNDQHNLVLSITESSEDNPDKEYVIKKGGTYQVKLLLSCLLTNKEDANYRNSLLFEVTEGIKSDIIGDDQNQDGRKVSKELESMEINIIPPFGEDKSYNKIWILILVSIVTYIKIKDNSK